ncbi:hypothetical protein AGLY_006544, partial [Aphis glycines]
FEYVIHLKLTRISNSLAEARPTMAFKKMSMFTSLVVVTIISYNVQNINSQSMVQPLIDQDFMQVKAALYELQEAEFNLMNDSQKLNDMQREYLAGKVEYSAVERARNELMQAKNTWFAKVLNYLRATNAFEPSVNYQNSFSQNYYQNTGPSDAYDTLNNINEMKANLGIPSGPPPAQV